MSIRRYQEADLDGVITVFLRGIREVAARDYDQAQIDAWAQVDRDVWRVRRASRPTWVSVDGETIIGFSDLEPDGHLDMMFVHPDHQGRGIATALLSTVEDAARSLRLATLFTEASITARPFFARRGFQVVAEQQVAKRGQILGNFRMRKAIAADGG